MKIMRNIVAVSAAVSFFVGISLGFSYAASKSSTSTKSTITSQKQPKPPPAKPPITKSSSSSSSKKKKSTLTPTKKLSKKSSKKKTSKISKTKKTSKKRTLTKETKPPKISKKRVKRGSCNFRGRTLTKSLQECNRLKGTYFNSRIQAATALSQSKRKLKRSGKSGMRMADQIKLRTPQGLPPQGGGFGDNPLVQDEREKMPKEIFDEPQATPLPEGVDPSKIPSPEYTGNRFWDWLTGNTGNNNNQDDQADTEEGAFADLIRSGTERVDIGGTVVASGVQTQEDGTTITTTHYENGTSSQVQENKDGSKKIVTYDADGNVVHNIQTQPTDPEDDAEAAGEGQDEPDELQADFEQQKVMEDARVGGGTGRGSNEDRSKESMRDTIFGGPKKAVPIPAPPRPDYSETADKGPLNSDQAKQGVAGSPLPDDGGQGGDDPPPQPEWNPQTSQSSMDAGGQTHQPADPNDPNPVDPNDPRAGDTPGEDGGIPKSGLIPRSGRNVKSHLAPGRTESLGTVFSRPTESGQKAADQIKARTVLDISHKGDRYGDNPLVQDEKEKIPDLPPDLGPATTPVPDYINLPDQRVAENDGGQTGSVDYFRDARDTAARAFIEMVRLIQGGQEQLPDSTEGRRLQPGDVAEYTVPEGARPLDPEDKDGDTKDQPKDDPPLDKNTNTDDKPLDPEKEGEKTGEGQDDPEKELRARFQKLVELNQKLQEAMADDRVGGGTGRGSNEDRSKESMRDTIFGGPKKVVPEPGPRPDYSENLDKVPLDSDQAKFGDAGSPNPDDGTGGDEPPPKPNWRSQSSMGPVNSNKVGVSGQTHQPMPGEDGPSPDDPRAGDNQGEDGGIPKSGLIPRSGHNARPHLAPGRPTGLETALSRPEASGKKMADQIKTLTPGPISPQGDGIRENPFVRDERENIPQEIYDEAGPTPLPEGVDPEKIPDRGHKGNIIHKTPSGYVFQNPRTGEVSNVVTSRDGTTTSVNMDTGVVEVDDGENVSTYWEDDDGTQRASHTDEDGNTTEEWTQTNDDGSSVTTTVDSDGNSSVTFTDADGNETTYAMDSDGIITRKESTGEGQDVPDTLQLDFEQQKVMEDARVGGGTGRGSNEDRSKESMRDTIFGGPKRVVPVPGPRPDYSETVDKGPLNSDQTKFGDAGSPNPDDGIGGDEPPPRPNWDQSQSSMGVGGQTHQPADPNDPNPVDPNDPRAGEGPGSDIPK